MILLELSIEVIASLVAIAVLFFVGGLYGRKYFILSLLATSVILYYAVFVIEDIVFVALEIVVVISLLVRWKLNV